MKAKDKEVLVALGANLPRENQRPLETCQKVVTLLDSLQGTQIDACSHWYESAPIPPSGQPPYINAVVRGRTSLTPRAFLQQLHEIERQFGRERSVPNAPRTLDLDLIDYEGVLCHLENLMLPHPRLSERYFVLYPLRDVKPDFIHPVTGADIQSMLACLGPQQIKRMP